MDLIGLLSELTSTGISDFVVGGIILLAVRYWLSETRREISKEIDDKIGAAQKYFQQSHQETRQELKDMRQDMKDLMLHVIDVRERLANIEGRLGAPTPRMSAVSPPLESPAEEPSAQS